MCAELEPLMHLIDRLPQGSAPAAGPDRFLQLVASRMRSCERRDGRLALLVAESAPARNTLEDELRTLRRGSDWLEIRGERAYALLDEPTPGWSAALRARLRDLPRFEQLRVVGLGWTPASVDAATLIAEAEGLLDQAPPGIEKAAAETVGLGQL